MVISALQGTGKTSTARKLRQLIDPNTSLVKVGIPHDQRNFSVSVVNQWVTVLDNLSYIPQWLSDALCTLSTGGGFSTRKLHSDDEEMVFEAKRPVILTGIQEIATRGDLLDRSLLLYPKVLTEHRDEGELDAAYEKALPRILGALLDAVVAALKNRDSVTFKPGEKTPRMVDFAKWVMAAEAALGLKNGIFMKAYMGNRGDANKLALEASPVAIALQRYLDDQPAAMQSITVSATEWK